MTSPLPGSLDPHGVAREHCLEKSTWKLTDYISQSVFGRNALKRHSFGVQNSWRTSFLPSFMVQRLGSLAGLAQAGMPERAKMLTAWQHLVWHVCLQPTGDAGYDPG